MRPIQVGVSVFEDETTREKANGSKPLFHRLPIIKFSQLRAGISRGWSASAQRPLHAMMLHLVGMAAKLRVRSGSHKGASTRSQSAWSWGLGNANADFAWWT
jgi:hypothetical protein